MSEPQTRTRTIAAWAAQLVAAGILAMASVMKLMGNPDSVSLFTTLGAEPWGRWAVALTELVAVILLLRPRTAAAGGALAAVLMLGAIGTHLIRLGIAYNGDPSLFVMAVIVLAAGVTTVFLRRRQTRAPTGT